MAGAKEQSCLTSYYTNHKGTWDITGTASGLHWDFTGTTPGLHRDVTGCALNIILTLNK